MRRIVAILSRALVAIALFAAIGAAAPARAAAQMTFFVDANNFYTGTSGAGSNGAFIAFSIWNSGTVDLVAPFTVRATMPAGFVYRGITNPLWSCTGVGQPVQLTCTYNTDITVVNYQSFSMSVYFDIPANQPLGAVTIDAVASSAQLPPPASPTCGASGSTTQCVRVVRQVQQSSLAITSMAAGPTPVYAGEEFSVVIDVRNVGYNPNNQPVKVRVRWPTGVSFARYVNGIPSWSCTGVQETICTTPYAYDGMTGFISLVARASATELPVPGPIRIVAGISNDVQPDADCVAQPGSTGCASVLVATAPARVPDLAITSTELLAQPMLMETDYPFVVNFANVGNGAEDAWSLSVDLPRGYAYNGLFSTIPAMTCAASGTPSTGQRVVCAVSAMPATTSGFASLRVRPKRGLVDRAQSTAVIAVESASPPDPSVLFGCASTPEAAHCAWQVLSARGICSEFAEDIYCDGYESTTSAAAAPAAD